MTQQERKRLLMITSTASVLVAIILILAKAYAWHLSGSVSLLASLLDSVVDSLASLISLFAIRYALVPADSDHRFGHGKAEALAGLGQAAFIGISALYLLWQAVEHIITPVELEAPVISIGVMVFSILVTSLLLLLQRYTIKRTGSTAIAADRLHYAADMAVNLSIIVALLLAAVGLTRADGIIGLGIALYILWSAWRLGAETIQLLLDREMPEDVRAAISSVVAQHDKALGFHELRTRQSGYTLFIQLHVDMDENMPLKEAHALAESIEAGIKQRYPASDVIIHEDPVSVAPQVALPAADELPAAPS